MQTVICLMKSLSMSCTSYLSWRKGAYLKFPSSTGSFIKVNDTRSFLSPLDKVCFECSRLFSFAEYNTALVMRCNSWCTISSYQLYGVDISKTPVLVFEIRGRRIPCRFIIEIIFKLI